MLSAWSRAGTAQHSRPVPCRLLWAPTLVDAVVRHSNLQADLEGGPTQVLQLLHSLLAHVLQLGHVVVHVGDLHLAGRACPPGGHLRQACSSAAAAGSHCAVHCRRLWLRAPHKSASASICSTKDLPAAGYMSCNTQGPGSSGQSLHMLLRGGVHCRVYRPLSLLLSRHCEALQ